jgi:hypothetical protein
VVVRRGQAGCLTDRAVNVGYYTARAAHDVMVVVPDPALEPRLPAGRLDAPNEPCRGQRVQSVIDGLEGHVAHTSTHLGGDRLDAKVITVPDGLEQRHPGGRYPQAGTAQFLRGGGSLGRGHGANLLL